MKKTVYITTSIPYVNGDPHIGFSLEVVQADALARWNRLLKHDTYYLAGVDENAIKIVEAAEKKKIPTQEMADQLSKKFLDLAKILHLTYDQFVRTSSEKHKAGVQKFWQMCDPKDIYIKEYEGLYCVGCETFYKDGQFPDNICPEHNRPLETVKESNYFFRLTKYKDQIKELIENSTLEVIPDVRKNEVIAMLESDLEDFSISRPVERTKGWGTPIPGDKTQMVYVWFDALTNYITALDFANNGELYQHYWEKNKNRYHVIGKNITKFHAIYWIGMLLSAKIPLPKKIYVHGFINVEGKKMSKSLGNVVDPNQEVSSYGTDAVRYYLLREIPSMDDGDFSHHRMEEIYSSELANELGNLVLRITTLAEKDGIDYTPPVIDLTHTKYAEITAAYEGFEFNNVAELIWQNIKELNREINIFEPWKKTAEERKEFLEKSLGIIYEVGCLLEPIIPLTSDKITLATQGKIHKIAPLFPRRDK